MKISNITPIVTMPIDGLPWLFVKVETDDGYYGFGECTDYSVNLHLVNGIKSLRSMIIGMDASNIENIWQTIFHSYDDLNGRGYVSHLISAIDIALWDIKGKVLNTPIYNLLGGAVRNRVPLYTHVQDYNSDKRDKKLLGGAVREVSLDTNDQDYNFNAGRLESLAKAAKETKKAGYDAIKTDPFPSSINGYSGPSEVERLTPKLLRLSLEWMQTLREAVGDDYELMVDAHARFDVASAIAAGKQLEDINLVWLEEPIHVENHNALRQVKENINIPICIGERHFTRWDYTEIFNNRLAEYVMPDVAWCGGISELRRIAAQAEVNYIRISPHDALGPISIAAGFQVCMTTPNLYRQECLHTWFNTFEKIINPMFTIENGAILPNNLPGLGLDLNIDEVKKYEVNPENNQYLNITDNDQNASNQWIN